MLFYASIAPHRITPRTTPLLIPLFIPRPVRAFCGSLDTPRSPLIVLARPRALARPRPPPDAQPARAAEHRAAGAGGLARAGCSRRATPILPAKTLIPR